MLKNRRRKERGRVQSSFSRPPLLYTSSKSEGHISPSFSLFLLLFPSFLFTLLFRVITTNLSHINSTSGINSKVCTRAPRTLQRKQLFFLLQEGKKTRGEISYHANFSFVLFIHVGILFVTIHQDIIHVDVVSIREQC